MWRCGKCGADVEDSVALCWICGTAPEGTEYSGSLPAEKPRGSTEDIVLAEVVGERPGAPPPGVGVPRRFGLGKLMAITAPFAVLFSAMRWMNYHPVIFVVVGVFVAGIGIAQPLLFGGKYPRKASIVAGAILLPAMWLTWVVCSVVFNRNTFARSPLSLAGLPFLYVSVLMLIPLGGAFGYVAGSLIASLFLGKPQVGQETSDHRSQPSRSPWTDEANDASEDSPGAN